MTKTILTTGGTPTATTANTIQYWPLAVTSIEGPLSSEAHRQILYRSPGTISKLYIKVTANTINATSTINVRKNAADTGLSLNVGANATGAFENSSDTVTISAGDKLNYQTTPGAATGTMSISIFSVLYDATTDTVTHLALAGPSVTYTTASVSRYNGIEGNQSSNNGSETAVKCKIRKAGIGKNLAAYVSANARLNDTIIRTRKNATNGGCVLTIGSTLSGWFEDTTGSDTLAVGDDYALVAVTGLGTEAMTVQTTSFDFTTTSRYGLTHSGRTAGFTIPPAATHYFPIGGTPNAGTLEVNAQQKPRIRIQCSELVVHLLLNTITADSTVIVRKNGVDTSLAVTMPNSTVGYFSDSTHVEEFATTDEISLQIIVGGTGTNLVLKSITLSTFDLSAEKTLSETESIDETRTRTKAVWRLQP